MATNDEEFDDEFEDDDDEAQSSQPESSLIKKLRRENKTLSKENKTLKKDSEELSTIRKDRLVADAGLSELTERKRRAVLREAEESGVELTKDNIREIAIDLGYAEEESVDNEADTRINNASEGAKGGKGSGKITPKDFQEWDPDKQRRFLLNHHAEYQLLKKNEAVMVPSFQ